MLLLLSLPHEQRVLTGEPAAVDQHDALSSLPRPGHSLLQKLVSALLEGVRDALVAALRVDAFEFHFNSPRLKIRVVVASRTRPQ